MSMNMDNLFSPLASMLSAKVELDEATQEQLKPLVSANLLLIEQILSKRLQQLSEQTSFTAEAVAPLEALRQLARSYS
jgi:hypothetical protein